MNPWGDAARTRDLAHVSWMASTAVLVHLNERATGDPARDWLSGWAWRWCTGENLRVLVVGCGEGWLERAIVTWPFIAHIDAVDVAAEAVARARTTANELGLTKLHYDVVDLNTAVLPERAYDVIIAHSVLHHVERLEHAYEQLERALRPDGLLLVNEYVGPNRFQYSDDVLTIMNELLRCLPERLRRGALEPRVYDVRTRPTVEEMLASDPTEAVRAEEVVPQLSSRFTILDRRDLGGTLLQHLLHDIAQNFRWDDPRERAMIELLCTIEWALVPRIGSDFAIFAAAKTNRAPKRPLPPRPEAARDTDKDPLLLAINKQRSSTVNRQPSTLPAWAIRTLRILLASQLPTRKNLFEKRIWLTLREQLRFAAARTTPFDWIRARWQPRGEEDRPLAELVDAFERIHSRFE